MAKDISWCGRKISENSVSYDESRISGLANLPVPENAAQLQKFICTANWIRNTLPEFLLVVSPLQELLRTIERKVGSMKPSKLKSQLLESQWTDVH